MFDTSSKKTAKVAVTSRELTAEELTQVGGAWAMSDGGGYDDPYFGGDYGYDDPYYGGGGYDDPWCWPPEPIDPWIDPILGPSWPYPEPFPYPDPYPYPYPEPEYPGYPGGGIYYPDYEYVG